MTASLRLCSVQMAGSTLPTGGLWGAILGALVGVLVGAALRRSRRSGGDADSRTQISS